MLTNNNLIRIRHVSIKILFYIHINPFMLGMPQKEIIKMLAKLQLKQLILLTTTYYLYLLIPIDVLLMQR